MKKKISSLVIFLLVLITSCSKRNIYDKKIKENNLSITDNNISEAVEIKKHVQNEQYLWTSDKGEYITNEKNTNVSYNAILSDYCIKNNWLIEGDDETGYKLFIGNPNYFMETIDLSDLENYSNELLKVYSIYIYTTESLFFDGSLFPNLYNLYVVAKKSSIKNVNNLISLVLEEKEKCELDFLFNCHELEDLFVFSTENIELPDMSNLENLSTVSILSSNQKSFKGIETIPCDFNFVFREKNVYLETLKMNDVDYSAFLQSNCIAFLIDNECYQKYKKYENFSSIVSMMRTNKNFVVSIVD